MKVVVFLSTSMQIKSIIILLFCLVSLFDTFHAKRHSKLHNNYDEISKCIVLTRMSLTTSLLALCHSSLTCVSSPSPHPLQDPHPGLEQPGRRALQPHLQAEDEAPASTAASLGLHRLWPPGPAAQMGRRQSISVGRPAVSAADGGQEWQVSGLLVWRQEVGWELIS